MLSCLTFFILVSTSPAQSPHHYQPPIDHFFENDQRDSFLHYARLQLQVARAADSLALWAWTQVQIQDFFVEQSAEALTFAETALKNRWRRPRDTAEWKPLLWLQCSRAYHLFRTGRVLSSVQAYEQADSIYQKYAYPDFDAVESLYKPLGNHYTRLGDNEKALALFLRALPLAQIESDPEVLAGLYNNMAAAFWNQGDFPQAAQYYQKGLAFSGLSPDKQGLLTAGLARTFLDEGQAEKAFQTAQTALRLLQPRGEAALRILEYRMRARLTAGLAALQTKRFDAAAQLLGGAEMDATAVFGPAPHRDKGKIALAFCALYQARAQPQLALAAANRALKAVLPGFEPHTAQDNPIADGFYEENTIVEALQQKAVAAKGLYDQNKQLYWLDCALDCYTLANEAENVLRGALQYQSAKLGLQGAARHRAEAAVEIARWLYEKTGRTDYLYRAFALVEGSKAALLQDAVRQNLGARLLGTKDVRLQTQQTLRRALAYLDKQLLLEPQHEQAPVWHQERDALIGQLYATEKALRQVYPALFEKPLSQTGAASLVPRPKQEETLLAYFCSDTSLHLFMFTNSAPPVWRCMPFDNRLQQTVRQFMAFFSSADAILRAPAAYFDCAWDLSRAILPPETARTPQLVLIPDGWLHFLPFEALLSEAPGTQTNLYNAPYLLRRQTLRSAWSLAVLQQQEKLVSGAPHYLLGLAPMVEMGVRGLPALPASSAEWRAVSKRRELLGPVALAGTFTACAADYRILHLSTHALAEAREGQPPRIELWDQALLLPDIYALSLQADLVVLSACQTSLGVEQKGEGIMSFARAFAHSGAAAVIASLWTVNDRSTAQIMEGFYQNLDGGKTIADALKTAKLAYLSNPDVPPMLQSPYFWAALTMTGADKAVNPTNAQLWYWYLGLLLLLLAWALIFLRKKT